MKKNLISIIIPNFNKEQYIIDTLNSVRSQTFVDFEVIIVDDRSTDNSIEIIEEYCKKDNRFQLIQRQREPKGGSVCRNIGLENAKGDYIIFLDSDDLLLPDTLENRIQVFLKYTDMDFLVFPMGTFKQQIGDNASVWIPQKNNHLKYFLSHRLSWTVTSPIWRKGFLLKIGGFDEAFPRLQDVELHTRVLLDPDVSYKVFPKVTPDCFYRIDEERIVDNYDVFVEKWTDGVLMYIEKMSNLIRRNEALERKKLLKYLNGTLLSVITQILYSYKQGKIDVSHKDKMLDKLLKNTNDLELLSHKDNLLIGWYIKGYEAGLYKIKGFNYISRKLVVEI